jgi:hypothetical protein
MASPNFSLVTKCFLVVLLGIALVVLNSGKIPLLTNAIFDTLRKETSNSTFIFIFIYFLYVVNIKRFVTGYAVAEIPPCETLLTQGPCSNFPDCNQHCLSIGWKCGGLCKAPAPGTPLACLCKI